MAKRDDPKSTKRQRRLAAERRRKINAQQRSTKRREPTAAGGKATRSARRGFGHYGELRAHGILAAGAVGAVCMVGLLALGRWHSIEFADSMWLGFAISLVVACAVLGWIAPRRQDVTGVAIGGGVITLALLALESVTDPDCLLADCDAFGALQQWGPWLSLVAVAALTALAIGAGMVTNMVAERFAWGSRPECEGADLVGPTVAGSIVLGLPIFALLLMGDGMLRPDPARASRALEVVERECFGGNGPRLGVRPHPTLSLRGRSIFLVGIEDEPRRDAKRERIERVAFRPEPSPYEAVVHVSRVRELTTVSCKLIDPELGDVGTEVPAGSNPAVSVPGLGGGTIPYQPAPVLNPPAEATR